MVKVLRSMVRGPLEPHIVGFAEQLQRQGYTQTSAEQHVCFLAHLDRWMSAEGVGLDGLARPVIERYLERRCAAGYFEYRSLKALGPADKQLGRSSADTPRSAVLDQARLFGCGPLRPLLDYLAPLGVLPVEEDDP